ncbi:FecCD family ABC transporter permease [Salipaludibacillus sp. HK11]|uniref:FecCD family ABC transporter permease n=1 Tax=Salipaludibacillus sp. HK11 TaxID=3394320 RepID=UPI0039FD2607
MIDVLKKKVNNTFTLLSTQPLIRIVLVLLFTIGLIVIWNLTRGAPNVPLLDLWNALFATDSENTAHFLINELRLPRMLLVICCGGALGIAGVLLQDSLRNPLADPGLLGVSQGASFIVAFSFIYPELMPNIPLPILCLISGSLAGIAVLLLSGMNRSSIRVIICGAIVSSFIGTFTTALVLLAPPDKSVGLAGYFRFVIGSASGSSWNDLIMLAPWLIVGLSLAFLSGRALNLLQLGDDHATGMGLNPFRIRMFLLLIAMILISPVIATIGPVSFIALFAPHIARGMLRSSDSRKILLLSFLFGVVLLTIADTIGRLLFFPAEVPAGVWTILIIGPCAIAVVGRTRGNRA